MQKGFVPLLLLLVILVIFVAVFFFLLKGNLLFNKSTAIAPTTQYANPFNKDTQYVNPFSSYKNPFDNIK